MKSHLFLIPMIFAATAAIADTQTTAPSDAQAQAAALLSRPHALRAERVNAHSLPPSPASPALDAHESAAALLSGARARDRVIAHAESNGMRVSMDAQARAAALLSGSRSSSVQTKRTDGRERTVGRAF